MSLLPIHVVAAAIGLASGFVALFALKGATLHRSSGTIFVYAMLVMSATGAVMATMKSQRVNAAQGVLTFYLVATALLAVRRRVRSIDAAAMAVGLTVGVYDIALGFEALSRPTASIDGVPAAMVFAFGALVLLAAFGDLRMMLTGDLAASPRIARHLWRMCLALFVAAASFFLGPIRRVPEVLRIPALLPIPVLVPLVAMFYWLWRVRIRRTWRWNRVAART